MSDAGAPIDELARRIRPHYARFLSGRDEQCVLTAHSHQAWPDISREGQLACWDDAAALVDGKWTKVFEEILPSFQAHVAARLGTRRCSDIAVAVNTHELVYRLASCFSPAGPVVTTDSEFHSLRRQLDRLEEDGLRVTRVSVEGDGGPERFAERFCAALDAERPAWAALSHVLFTTARVITDLPVILAHAAELGVPVLVDTYHGFNALEMDVDAWPGQVFVVGGGYKYAQTGEGACWMLLPEDASDLRPRHTGWFADFAHLDQPQHTVGYGQGGFRFMGATFDPSGLYRGLWTLRWMDQMKLSPRILREQSLRGTRRIIERFDALELASRGVTLASPREDAARGGFVSFRTDRAGALSAQLREAGVHTDSRADLLRFGPAPYTLAWEIDQGVETLAALV